MNNTELKIFSNNEFGNIRTMMINNESYFVGKDVADILGYQNGSRDVNRHVSEEDKGVTKCDTLGGTQNLTIINEASYF